MAHEIILLIALTAFIIYYDFRDKKIPNVLLAIMVGVVIYVLGNKGWPQENLSLMAIIALGMIFLKLSEKGVRRTFLGDADKILFVCCMAWLNLPQLPLFLILCGIFGILTALIWRITYKDPLFPFAPAILFSLLVTQIF